MHELALDPRQFDIETLIQRAKNATFTFEYNCDMRRIYPWGNMANTKRFVTEFGLVWVEVKQGTDVDAHEHDEEETFMILSGRAELDLEGHTVILEKGDVVYIPRFWRHQMCNPFEETLVFADIYWDFKGRTKQEYLENYHDKV